MRLSLLLSLLLFVSCGSEQEPGPNPEPEPKPEPQPEVQDEGLVRKADMKKLGFPDDAFIQNMGGTDDRREFAVNHPDHAVNLFVRVRSFAGDDEAQKAFEAQHKIDVDDGVGEIYDERKDWYTLTTARPSPDEKVTMRSVQRFQRIGKHFLQVGAGNTMDQEMPEEDLRKIVENAIDIVKERL